MFRECYKISQLSYALWGKRLSLVETNKNISKIKIKLTMYSYKVFIFIATFVIILLNTLSHAQFWKMNDLSEKDLFIMETRARMESGICYKEVP